MVENVSCPRVMLLGLDMGVGKLIRDWAAQGFLPVFSHLIKNGRWGYLNTTAEMLHVSGWPSIYTGTLPGKHGVYYTFQPSPGKQGWTRFGANQYGQPTLWQMLSRAGKKCIVFDAPYTHPLGDFDGLQIFEWGTWARYWKPMSIPREIMSKLKRHFGKYPLGIEANQVGMARLDPMDLIGRLTAAVMAKVKAGLWLMSNYPWDLFFMVFGETHPAAHYFWPRDKKLEDTNLNSPSLGVLRKVYEAVDRGIGEILTSLGANVTVFVISPDSVGPNYSGWHLLPEVLRRLGFIVGKETRKSNDAYQYSNDLDKGGILNAAKSLVPVTFRKSIATRLPTKLRDFVNLRIDTAYIDWSKSRAYCLPTDLEGCIRINCKGREPKGIVDHGAEFDGVCEEMRVSLQRLINPATGRPAIEPIILVEEMFPGDCRHNLPDLVVRWSQEAEIKELYSPDIGTVGAPSPDPRTGTHHPPGFVIAHGPSIARGRAIEGGHIVDLAPTILSQFHQPIPDHMDGTILNELRT